MVWGGKNGDGVAGDGTGKLNCFIVNMLDTFPGRLFTERNAISPAH